MQEIGRDENAESYIWLLEKQNSLLRLHALTVFVSLLLMIGKFFAWYLTGSNAILTDALESIVNVLAGAFAFYSLWLSFKPRDHDHPYGHGKIEFVSASIEGALIGVAGLSILGKSIYNLFVPQTIQEVDQGIWLIAGAGIVNLLMGLILRRIGKNRNSLTLSANGQHLMSDAWSSAGLIIGLIVLYYTNAVWVDNVLGIGFGAYIIYVAGRILRKSIAGIMDEADFDLLTELVAHLDEKRKPDWIDIHNLRVIQYGSMLHIDCHVTLPWYYSLQEAHDVISELDHIIYEKYKKVELFIHMDPCITDSCRICTIADCMVRKLPFEKQESWELKSLLENNKHGTSLSSEVLF